MKKLKLSFTHNDSIAQIILDDGKGNILDTIMMEELHYVLHDISKNLQIKLITFEGAGKHFSFGASVEEHKKEFASKMIASFHKLFYILGDLSFPLLAKVSGQCLGGGMELILMCNFIFADKSARLGQPEILLGVFPPPASIILSEKIGLARSEEILLTGRNISAEEGKQIGLFNGVYETREILNAAVEEWIQIHILPKSASSLRYATKAVRTKLNHIIRDFLPQLEHLYVDQLMETNDANEGIQSFLEKRKPVWKNN